MTPANRPPMPAFWAALRQVPSRPPAQVGTSRPRSNAAWQARVSFTIPSAAPSSASQRRSTASETSLRSAGVNAEPMSAAFVARLA